MLISHSLFYILLCNLFQFLCFGRVSLDLVGVYISSSHFRKIFLWNDLTNLQGPWCILGDFNVIFSVEESKGGNPWDNSNNLLSLPFYNSSLYLD